MKFNGAPLLLALLTATLGLASCDTPANVKYPTVQQLDDLDVQWGLPRRVSKGGPSRTYAYDPAADTARRSPSGSVPAVPANNPAAPAPDVPLQPAQPSMQIPDVLR